MMTRAKYIEAVKTKLEEISPFSEPESYIEIDANDPEYGSSVKPITSYVDRTIDEAARNCLRDLPLTLLHADTESIVPNMVVDAEGMASFAISPNNRFIRFRHPELKRDITAFITSEDPLYLIQQNVDTRARTAKPVAVISTGAGVANGQGNMEIYSLQAGNARAIDSNGRLLKINLNKKVGVQDDYWTDDVPPVHRYSNSELIQSPIEEFIILECAAMVAEIIKDPNAASVCREEKERKLSSIL